MSTAEGPRRSSANSAPLKRSTGIFPRLQAAPLNVLGRDAGLLRAESAWLYAMVWSGHWTAERLAIAHADLLRLYRHRRSVTVLGVVRAGTPVPSPGERDRLSALQAQVALSMRGLVLLVEGEGFARSDMLSALTGALGTRRHGLSQTFCRTGAEAVEALLPLLPHGGISAGALTRHLEAVLKATEPPLAKTRQLSAGVLGRRAVGEVAALRGRASRRPA